MTSNDGLIIKNMDLSHVYLAVKTYAFCVDSQSKLVEKKNALTGSKQTTHEQNIKKQPYKSNVLDNSCGNLQDQDMDELKCMLLL